jgi:hypothetical protein
MVIFTTCRGCGLRIATTARFCYVCRVPDPVLSVAAGKRGRRRKLVISGGVAALAWVATCVGLWLIFSR